MRKSIVAANWKMNGDAALVEAFANSGLKPNDKVQVIFGLPAIFLREASKAGITDLSAEDVSAHDKGAYTGETSASMLKEAGVKYCIIGHSERRTYHGEDEKILADKWLQLKSQGIIPIYCIGETEAEYDAYRGDKSTPKTPVGNPITFNVDDVDFIIVPENKKTELLDFIMRGLSTIGGAPGVASMSDREVLASKIVTVEQLARNV